MTLSAPLRLNLEDKLDALRKLDPDAKWESLDDRRYCTRCDHLISGRQVKVAGGTRADRSRRLECPTADCAGTPADWVAADQRGRHLMASTNDLAAHHAGYVEIRGAAEGISITHDGRIAVVRRTRSGRTLPLSEFAQSSRSRAGHSALKTWLVRRTAALATDCRSVLSLLRPRPRGHFHPVQ